MDRKARLSLDYAPEAVKMVLRALKVSEAVGAHRFADSPRAFRRGKQRSRWPRQQECALGFAPPRHLPGQAGMTNIWRRPSSEELPRFYWQRDQSWEHRVLYASLFEASFKLLLGP